MAVLITARLVQGAGAALLVPASLVLLQAAYPTREGRSRAFGAWGSIAGIGAATGPILTGALAQAGRLGWTSPLVLAGLAVAAAVWAAFVITERRSPDPMLPLALFSRAAFRSGTAVGLLINLGFYGQLFVISLYFQDLRGYSALRTGVAVLPEAVLLIVASTMSGRIMARTGPRGPMLAGLLTGGAGLAGIAAAGAHTAYALLILPMAAAGFGMALTMPAATAAVMEAAPADRSGIASGVVNGARQAGGVLGVALLGAFVAGAVVVAAGVPRWQRPPSA